MKKLNNNKKVALVAGSLAAVVATSGALAYFTDNHSTVNKFTIGNVTTELQEPHWSTTDSNKDGVPDVAENLVPGKVISKDPKIQNIGKNSAYVFLEVKVPMANIITASDDGTRNAVAAVELYSYSVNTGWSEMSRTVNNEKNEVTYVYAYNTVLAPNDSTGTLFDNIKFVNVIEGQGLENTAQQVDVKSKAIQSEGSANYSEAYAKFVAQNS